MDWYNNKNRKKKIDPNGSFLMESMGFEPMRDGSRLQAFQACLFSLLSNFPKIYPPELVGILFTKLLRRLVRMDCDNSTSVNRPYHPCDGRQCSRGKCPRLRKRRNHVLRVPFGLQRPELS